MKKQLSSFKTVHGKRFTCPVRSKSPVSSFGTVHKVLLLFLIPVFMLGCISGPVKPVLKKNNKLRDLIFDLAEEFEQGFNREEAERSLLKDKERIVKISRSKERFFRFRVRLFLMCSNRFIT